MPSGRGAERQCAAPAAGRERGPNRASLLPLSFADLAGFSDDDHREAFGLFAQHAAAILRESDVLRPALPASEALRNICRQALAHPPRSQAAARLFFETHFVPHLVLPGGQSGKASGFVTGYYEPVTAGSLTPSKEFSAPVLGRPDDLVTLPPGEHPPGLDPNLTAARRLPDGRLSAYFDRAAIEAGALEGRVAPLVFLKDWVEVFFAQVQGSARIALPDGTCLRLTYAGRNGHPYTSIGRILVEAGEIPAESVGLESVKAWIRAKGQAPGEAGRALMLRNKSYVFFARNAALSEAEGPIGGAGLSLMPLRSIAVDRQIWSYGVPFWLSGELPWQDQGPTPFRRLMIAADTGAAILGPARADIFFGIGSVAGTRAGGIRHDCAFTVLLPRADGEGGLQ